MSSPDPNVRSSPKSMWAALTTLLCILHVGYTWIFSAVSVPNERSRVYLSVALVDEWTTSIDTPVARFGRIYDWATHEGHYYSDKAPGSSFLGAAVYGVARLFTEPGDWDITELLGLMRAFVMVPLSLVGLLWLRGLLRSLDVRAPVRDVASLIWLCTTAASHYAGAFYGHHIVAVTLVGSLYYLLSSQRADDRGAPLLAAGLLAGLAGLTEYQAVIPAAALCVFAAAQAQRRWRALALFALGGAPAAVALLVYHWLSFGGPFELPYHHLVDAGLQEVHGTGIAGVGRPTLAAVWGSTFSLHRGLFATSPVLLFAIPGIVLLGRHRRGLGILLGVVFAYFLLFIFGSSVWFAGWSYGPRLLVPVLGLAVIPVAWLLDRAADSPLVQGLARGAAVAGLIQFTLVRSVFPEPPETHTNPIVDVVAPALEAGITSPNLASWATGSLTPSTMAPFWVLAGIIAAALLVRGVRLRGARWLAFAALTLVPSAAVGAAIAAKGPGASEEQRAGFVRLLHKFQDAERRRAEGRRLASACDVAFVAAALARADAWAASDGTTRAGLLRCRGPLGARGKRRPPRWLGRGGTPDETGAPAILRHRSLSRPER